MAQTDRDARHLDTLDRDLGRFSTLESATVLVSRPLVAPGIALAFVILAGLGADWVRSRAWSILLSVVLGIAIASNASHARRAHSRH